MKVKAPFRWDWKRCDQATERHFAGFRTFSGLLQDAHGQTVMCALSIPTLQHFVVIESERGNLLILRG